MNFWRPFDPHGALVQHVHVASRSPAGVWTERAYTYRFPHSVRAAMDRERKRGRLAAFRFCGADDERRRPQDGAKRERTRT